MPQYQTCVRCGSILPGSDSSVSVEPPRAGKLEKMLRLASVIRTTNRVAGVVTIFLGWVWQKCISIFQLEIRSADLTILGMFWKGFVPGFAQWYIGRKPQDQFFFFGWLILLVLAFLTHGLTVANLLLGLAISWHLMSFIDVAIAVSARYSDRFFLFCLMVIGAILLFYLPTSALCWNHLGIQGVTATVGPLRSGDSLLYTGSWGTITPRVGSIVVYQAPNVQYPPRGNTIYRLGGNMFDRVLALEEQTVSWQEGTLFIDGELSPHQPLVPVAGVPNATFVVPEGECYIVPGVAFSPRAGFRHLAVPADAQTWQAVGLVPYESVYGVVWGARRTLFHFVNLQGE